MLAEEDSAMAVRERVTILGNTSPGFNVEFPVGQRSANHRSDVMLVQAMFNLLVDGFEGRRITGIQTGMKSQKEIPKINGEADAVTLAAIRTFQRRWAHNILMTDGIIDPARYFGRDIQTTGTGLMMITLMHQLLQNVAAENFQEEDYTDFMFWRFPELRVSVHDFYR
jgi:hypothetical protein